MKASDVSFFLRLGLVMFDCLIVVHVAAGTVGLML